MADQHDIGGRGVKAAAPETGTPGRKGASVTPVTAPSDGAGAVPSDEARIEEYRRRIDQIDEQLMKLLNSRSACAVEIGRIKRQCGMPVYQPEREQWILERVARNNPGPLDSGAVRRVFERVIDESRRLERLAGAAESGKEGD